MVKKITLTELEQDALAELMNVSFGLAASIISDALKSFSKLPLPKIETFPIDQLDSFIKKKLKINKNYYVTTQQFKNNFEGESIFIIEKDSAKKLAQLLYDLELNELLENEIKSGVSEITNIISSACVGRLLELLNTNVFFSPPKIDLVSIENNLYKLLSNQKKTYTNVIVIETFLEFQDENIIGQLMILCDQRSFKWLKTALNDYIGNKC